MPREGSSFFGVNEFLGSEIREFFEQIMVFIQDIDFDSTT
jgi:hypothetical protein